MTLPPRQAKKPKKPTRWRSQAHLSFIRSFHCAIPGCQGMPIEAAHVRIGSGAGMGEKPDDWRCVPLCGGLNGHHSLQHQHGEKTFWETYQLTSGQTADELIDSLCRASPKAAEIWRRRNGGA